VCASLASARVIEVDKRRAKRERNVSEVPCRECPKSRRTDQDVSNSTGLLSHRGCQARREKGKKRAAPPPVRLATNSRQNQHCDAIGTHFTGPEIVKIGRALPPPYITFRMRRPIKSPRRAKRTYSQRLCQRKALTANLSRAEP